MKKKLMNIAIVGVVCSLCAFNYFVNVKPSFIPEQTLSQVEALGQSENSGGKLDKASEITEILCFTDGEVGCIVICVKGESKCITGCATGIEK